MLKLNGAWLCGLSSVPQGSGLSMLRSSVVFGTKEVLAMAPNGHPHVAILIVTSVRLVGAVEDCLQRRLSKTNLIRQLNIKHGRCKRTIIYSHLTNRKVRDESFTVVCFDTGGNPLVPDILSLVFQKKLDINDSGENGIRIRILTSSSDRRSRPSSSSPFRNCSSVDLMTMQDVIFSLSMVSLLWFWLTQPTPVKTLFFS